MQDKKLLERIVVNPKIMVGKPVISGTRLTVDFILNLLAHGATKNEIINEYQGLTVEDIQACFLFATKSLENTDFMRFEIKCAVENVRSQRVAEKAGAIREGIRQSCLEIHGKKHDAVVFTVERNQSTEQG